MASESYRKGSQSELLKQTKTKSEHNGQLQSV